MPPPTIRPATPDDLLAILDILTPEITLGFAHFATSPPALDELLAEFHDQSADYPWLVAVDTAGILAGFARTSPWKSRGGYRWTAEVGVYVRGSHRGRGVATDLYRALFPRLESLGLRSILAGIALPNPASVRLHESFGFTHVGTLPSVGFKLGHWRSVGYWHRFLGDPTSPPPDAGLK